MDGKCWERSWKEAFWEAQVGLVCAGNVEGSMWKHPGEKMTDLHLGVISDSVILHGEFPFS